MLDSKEMAKRLKAAMDGHEPPITGAELAKACGVTPQAVSGWRSTGRIGKQHLQTIAALTDKPLEYFLSNGRGGKKSEVRESPMEDQSGFNVVLRAWQETDEAGRGYILGIAKAVGRANGLKGKRRTSG